MEPVNFGTILTSLIAGSLGSVGGGLIMWWRHSAVQQAKNDARDAKQEMELHHFRVETEKIFTEMRMVMNGFGARLDTATERQGKMWNTMFGALEKNGMHGDVKDLIRSMATLSARVDGVARDRRAR